MGKKTIYIRYAAIHTKELHNKFISLRSETQCGNEIKAVALRRPRRADHRSGGRRDCVFQTCVLPVHKGI